MIKKDSVSVIGIGRVGLPLALVLADSGYTVYGIGRSEEKIEKINKGIMPFIERGASTLLKKVVKEEKFTATLDYSKISESEYIILTLGTPVDENMNPVFDQINTSLNKAKPYLSPNQTLILRSTVSPRSTQYVLSLLNKINNIQVGKNFFLAFCPERISEGNAVDEIKSIPQIIGGVDKKSSEKARQLFARIGAETIISDDVSAELAKLFTNMYRYINFAIANEFMLLASNYNRDIYDIIHLVNHNYKRGGLNLPGLTAGPCLFKDGFFLISDLPYVDLISTSWKINESIPLFLIKKVSERMRLSGKKAVILGLAFKPEIDDIRESLSFKIRKALIREGANVVLSDPFVTNYRNQVVEDDLYKAVEGADLIVIATNHKEYQKIDTKKLKNLVKKNCLISDVWNVMKTDKVVFKLNKLESLV